MTPRIAAHGDDAQVEGWSASLPRAGVPTPRVPVAEPDLRRRIFCLLVLRLVEITPAAEPERRAAWRSGCPAPCAVKVTGRYHGSPGRLCLGMDLTTCPTCGLVAEVEERFVLESTDGPLEHVAIRCVRRHIYRMPIFMLSPAAQPNPVRSTTTRR